MDYGDGEDAARGWDEGDFAEGVGEGGQELLCILCSGISWVVTQEDNGVSFL